MVLVLGSGKLYWQTFDFAGRFAAVVVLLTVGVSGILVVSELWAANFSPSQSRLFTTKGYRDAPTSEKLQLTESAIIKQVCTRI